MGQQNRNRQKKLQTLKVSKSLSVTSDSNTASVRSRWCKLFKRDKKARRLFFLRLMLHTKHDVMNQVTLLICSTTDSISMLVDYQQSNKWQALNFWRENYLHIILCWKGGRFHLQSHLHKRVKEKKERISIGKIQFVTKYMRSASLLCAQGLRRCQNAKLSLAD